MRLHISLDDGLVSELDERVGPRNRSRFIGDAVRHALDEMNGAGGLEAALGSIPDTGHEWDDPAKWYASNAQPV